MEDPTRKQEEASQEPATTVKKPWVTPEAELHPVAEVTRAIPNASSNFDGFLSCAS